ncbi:MAG: DapH/DapD/GlmU-related protein [bacterium]
MGEPVRDRREYEAEAGTYRRRFRFIRRKVLALAARFMPGTRMRLRFYRWMGVGLDRETRYIGPDCYLDDIYPELIHLGPGVVVSFRVTIVAHDHVTDTVAPVRVERDAFLGTGAILLPGVRVGAGAVVAAGAVVTGDVGEGVTVGGVPARPIGSPTG